MPLRAGERFGDYDIIGLLGAGGMGEVYRATDRALGRQVAIKIVAGQPAAGAERLSRFDREARLLASLNHPRIATIYGRTESSGNIGLVLELVEGPTLAERLGRPLPLADARAIALGLIDAISAAHEAGIVHRDLKPANIKITPGGDVKVLDFGLAKMMDGAPADPDASSEATFTSARTQAGTVMGTPAYMSPEQARGRDVDRRADIWAFGCILYEMLAGRRAFAGESSSDIIAAVIEREPDWNVLPGDLPSSIRALLRRCLAKDRKQRLHDIADARFDLAADDAAPQTDVGARRASWLPWLIAAGLGAALMATIAVPLWRPATVPTAARVSFVIPQPPGVQWGGAPVDPFPAPAPNGRLIAYAGGSSDGHRLWIHDVATGRATPVPGVPAPTSVAWSPDSKVLAYCSGQRITLVSLTGAAPAPLDGTNCGWGLSWSGDDQLLFASLDSMWRVAARGGTPQRLTIEDPAKGPHLYPQWLSDNRHFVYLARDTSAAISGIYLGSIDGGASTRLVADLSAPRFVAGPDGRGRLVFVRAGQLVSQVINANERRMEGEPVVLADNIVIGQTVLNGAYGVSPTLLVHRSGGAAERTELVVLDRVGRRLNTLEPDAPLLDISIAQDGSRLAVTRLNVTRNTSEVWDYDPVRGGGRPLIAKPYSVATPVFSTDGQIAVLSNESGSWRPMVIPPGGEPRSLPGIYAFLSHWSNDNAWIIGSVQNGLNAFRPDGSAERVAIPDAVEGQLSPDRKWLAYRSSESGTAQIYVRGFPGGGNSIRVSRDGGYKPSWRHDGRELFFRTANGTVMAAPIQSAATLTVDDPVPLFTAPFVSGNAVLPVHDFVVTRDGQRFIAILAKDASITPLTVVMNWLQ